MEGVKEQAVLEHVKNKQELSVAANSGDAKESLHPLTTGFRAASTATSGANATIPTPDQLTIFYGGNVLVFDAFPVDKAREIMLIAAAVVKPADMKPAAAVSPANSTSALPSPKGPACPISQGFSLCKLQAELPITRKHSLQRFFEKRRDRLSNKNPYSAPAAQISTSKIPDFRAEVSKDGGCTMQDKATHPEVAANVA